MPISDGATTLRPGSTAEPPTPGAHATTDEHSSPPARRGRSPALAIGAAAAALAASALYLPHLEHRLRQRGLPHPGSALAPGPAADTARRAHLARPLPVGFWRPVSTFLLGLELAVFGLHPARFHAAHLVVTPSMPGWGARIVAEVLRGRAHPRGAGAARSPRIARSDFDLGRDRSGGLFAVHPFTSRCPLPARRHPLLVRRSLCWRSGSSSRGPGCSDGDTLWRELGRAPRSHGSLSRSGATKPPWCCPRFSSSPRSCCQPRSLTHPHLHFATLRKG